MGVTEDRINALKEKEKQILGMGGEKAVAKHKEKGKLSARERIDALFDAGTFREIDMFVTHRCTNFGMDKVEVPSDGVVTGTVIEVVKGGLILDIGLRGFLPASLVEMRRVRDLQPYVGKEIEAKIIELDKNRNNVVLSRRAHLEEEQAEQRHAFLDDLAEGEVREILGYRKW